MNGAVLSRAGCGLYCLWDALGSEFPSVSVILLVDCLAATTIWFNAYSIKKKKTVFFLPLWTDCVGWQEILFLTISSHRKWVSLC